MIDFNTAIELIRRNGGFKPNRRDTSYYRTYRMEDSRPMQARISNHGTWLWTWYDKDYDPSYAINTCVVYSENGEDKSDVSVDMEIKDKQGNVVGERKSFEVIQYVYNCQILDDNDAALINQAVQNIWLNKGFKDPLANTHKHAKVMVLRPNETPEIITETKYTNMNKKHIRLTESDLKQIVKESVNKILNEAYGTVPKQDKVSQNAYRGADFDKSTYSDNNEQLIAEYMQKLASGIYNVMDASEWFGYYSEGEIFGDGKNPSLKKYSDLIYNKIQEIENIYQQIRRIMTMRLGLQPDTRYDIKHLSLDDEATLQWRDIAGPKAKRKADDYFDQYDKEKIMKQNRDVNKGRSFTAV